MALWQLLLEQGLYKTIPKISLASSNWSSPLSAINTYCSSLFHPEFTLPFSPCCAIWEKLPQSFSEHCYSPCKSKEHTKCFSNAISVWYQELFMSPPHLKDAFIHISEENSCSRPHKYPMCSMLSCTSLSSRSFKLVHVTIYHWQYTTADNFWQCHCRNFFNFIHLESWYLHLQTQYLYLQTRQLHQQDLLLSDVKVLFKILKRTWKNLVSVETKSNLRTFFLFPVQCLHSSFQVVLLLSKHTSKYLCYTKKTLK